jgi:hypothetical protein
MPKGILRFTVIVLCVGLLVYALAIGATEFVIGTLLGYFGSIITTYFGQHTDKVL